MKPRPTPTRILDDDATKAAKPIVLVLLGAYWPNHDATGPNQSFRAYVAALSDEFEFMVVGRDGPSGSDSPDASRGRWTDRRTRKDAPLPDFPSWRRGVARHPARDAT